MSERHEGSPQVEKSIPLGQIAYNYLRLLPEGQIEPPNPDRIIVQRYGIRRDLVDVTRSMALNFVERPTAQGGIRLGFIYETAFAPLSYLQIGQRREYFAQFGQWLDIDSEGNIHALALHSPVKTLDRLREKVTRGRIFLASRGRSVRTIEAENEALNQPTYGEAILSKIMPRLRQAYRGALPGGADLPDWKEFVQSERQRLAQ